MLLLFSNPQKLCVVVVLYFVHLIFVDLRKHNSCTKKAIRGYQKIKKEYIEHFFDIERETWLENT